MIQNISIEKLNPHPDNPRKDLGDLSELAESIKVSGILQNLTVVEDENNAGYYRIVIGHRRFEAAKQAGLTELPCIVADMDYKTQIGTMLLENIQRADLTVFEQAQGFQMMMDLGDSIKEISEKTGFSDTTVRHRVKLMELDQEKLKKAAGRSATIMDYIALEKIKDIGLRNEVLESIGTSNFNYNLKTAIEKEARIETINYFIEQLNTFAERVDKEPPNSNYVTWYMSSDKEIKIPEDAGQTKYYYTVSSGRYIYLYKEADEADEAKNKAYEEEKRIQKERSEALDAIAKRAFELRSDFILSFSNAKAKKKIEIIAEYTYRAIETDSFWSLEIDDITDFIGVQIPDHDDEELDTEYILEDLHKQPERHLLLAAYCSLDSPSGNYHNWRGDYSENSGLDLVYDFLDALGYDISDEEIAIKEGTHELFEREE